MKWADKNNRLFDNQCSSQEDLLSQAGTIDSSVLTLLIHVKVEWTFV